MPPERIDGESKEAYGVQADVWSLGITLVSAKGQPINIFLGRDIYGYASIWPMEDTFRTTETGRPRAAAQSGQGLRVFGRIP